MGMGGPRQAALRGPVRVRARTGVMRGSRGGREWGWGLAPAKQGLTHWALPLVRPLGFLGQQGLLQLPVALLLRVGVVPWVVPLLVSAAHKQRLAGQAQAEQQRLPQPPWYTHSCHSWPRPPTLRLPPHLPWYALGLPCRLLLAT